MSGKLSTRLPRAKGRNWEAYKVSDKPYEAFTVLDYRPCCIILQTCFLGILFNFVIFENFYLTSVYVRNILVLFPVVRLCALC